MSEPKTWPTEWTEEVRQALLAPFPAEALGFLPRGNSNGKAAALAYIEARDVMTRLDTVVGPHNWSFDFDPLDNAGKMVRGRLTVLGVVKCDAGQAASEDEPLKSSVSDALKRAAVHFGIGRFLYELPSVWAAFDAQKRKFTEPVRHHSRDIEAAARKVGYTGGFDAPSETRTEPQSKPIPPFKVPESRGDQQAQAAVKAAEKPLEVAGANRAAVLALDEKRAQLAQLIVEANLRGLLKPKQLELLESWVKHPNLELERANSFIETLMKQLGEATVSL